MKSNLWWVREIKRLADINPSMYELVDGDLRELQEAAEKIAGRATKELALRTF